MCCCCFFNSWKSLLLEMLVEKGPASLFEKLCFWRTRQNLAPGISCQTAGGEMTEFYFFSTEQKKFAVN